MKFLKYLSCCTIWMVLLIGCENYQPGPSISIIPLPVDQQPREGVFQFNRDTRILIHPGNESVEHVAGYLAGMLKSASWTEVPVEASNEQPLENVISLSLDKNTSGYKNNEAYYLSVTPKRISITAPTAHGLFYGVQTLRQLFPPEIEFTDPTLAPQNLAWTVPAVEIHDYPRYSYRGMHLDVARHFFPVEFIKRYIDLMAMHKMNRFHWHLTEDQAWRIEIKQYPLLTKVGAWRDSTLVGHYGSEIYDGERYGGFYTQEEIREVVEYAKSRFITVIPEIEMPGHSSAALAAYPELGCSETKDYQVQTTWGVFEDIYCPSETTFTFLENVLTEVMALFPSKYIHIGGDEAPKDAWRASTLAQQVIEREGLADEHELQSYFIQRIEKFLNSHGRQIIGWDEILEGGLAPNATVMSWRGVQGGIEAAKMRHNVIMTPGSHCYLDHYQCNPESEPMAIGGFTKM
jgi:hexosaminidase